MQLWSVISYLTLVGTLESITASETYTLNNINVTSNQILGVMNMWSQVECILGCKNYKGCVASSFNITNNKDGGGKCTYYSTSMAENQLNKILTLACMILMVSNTVML